jgi:hypothetical protein
VTHRHHCRRSARLQRRNRQRSGTVIVAALVCLLIVMSLIGCMLQGALRARRQLHAQRDLRQTEFLLQAGADRAAYRLLTETEYRGETWDVPAAEIFEAGRGQVMISASRDSEQEPWQVHVMAEYPLRGESSIRRSGTFLIQPQLPAQE